MAIIRPSWEDTWMAMADVIGKRSPCERRQVGAVIVDPSNRIVATGYNGPPRNLGITSTTDVLATCHDHCPRNQPNANPGIGYDDCITVHAESNALMFCDRRDREGGSIYVNSAVCFTCAKLVANSGLLRVFMRVAVEDAHRDPGGSIDIMRRADLEVIVW